MSPWALGNCDGHFSIYSIVFLDETNYSSVERTISRLINNENRGFFVALIKTML